MRLAAILLTAAALVSTGCIALPEGLHIYETADGCTSTSVCPYGYGQRANYYYAPLREVVIQPNQGAFQVVHEIMHAHQHAVILQETGREPTLDMREWLDTTEGRSFAEATGWTRNGETSAYGPVFLPNKTPWAWLSNQSPIEDFANTGAYWFLSPTSLDPIRYQWAAQNLQ